MLPLQGAEGAAAICRGYWMPSWPEEKLAAKRAHSLEELAAPRARAVATLFADSHFMPNEVR